MASLDPHIRPAGESVSPALLRDPTGKTILPTECLPGVDFAAHLHQDAPQDAAADDGSYFAIKPTQEPTEPVEAPPADPDAAKVAESTAAAPSLARSRTAPLGPAVTRPTANNRKSWLRRGVTGARANNSSNPYAYTFDAISSDSSSSSEDESPPQESEQKSGLSRRHTEMPDPAVEQAQKAKRSAAKKGLSYSHFNMGNEHFRSKGHVSKRDGRLNISVNETANTGVIAKAFGQSIKHHLDIPNGFQHRKQRRYQEDHPSHKPETEPEKAIPEYMRDNASLPRLNIVIMVIGSRGDIQPFLKIGQILKHQYGHRVRIATHPTFRDFVQNDIGLEFFSIGGDPSELMAFMVKNPGLIPSVKTIREGEIHRRRAAMGEMFEGMWRATINAFDDDETEANQRLVRDTSPFVADAIIANPPSMAHVHIAEKLGIPLHIMFTFPYSPTQQFPHPLANIRAGKSNVDANYVNFMSYPLVEMMTWQGLGDIVNKFRENTLKLEPVSSLWAPGALYRMKVPYTYMWSPTLIPKPFDWGPEISISGFCFLDLANKFKPPEDLAKFLDAGEPPVYIGFGSIVVDDPEKFTEMIFEAVKLAGVRAVVNKGWGGLGRDGSNTPDNVFMIGNTPHDWLFPRVKAVVHHGGAGTTAIGLKCAKPTMVVPFFGDQSFWAARLVEAKAGAQRVVPWKKLTAELFAEGIKQCLTEEAQINVQKLADSIAKEGDGAENAVKSFHRCLPLEGKYNMRCAILEDRSAAWVLHNSSMRLSPLAAEMLIQKGKIKHNDLSLFRAFNYGDFDGPGEPVTGGIGALADSFTEMGAGLGMVPVRVAKHIKKRQDHEHKKAQVEAHREERRKRKTLQQQQATEKPEEKSEEHKSGETTNGNDPRPANERTETAGTTDTTISADPNGTLTGEVAGDIGHGLRHAGAALLTLPNDFHVAIAQGFHNAPRLWGDATVRKPIRVTGIRTGFQAARYELVYGVYDAFTGLVTQPVAGFKEGDNIPSKLTGMTTGFGKGIGGFVLKNLSAAISPPAYICKGSVVYVKKRFEGPESKADIKRSRFAQGRDNFRKLRDSEDEDTRKYLAASEEQVEDAWKTYQAVLELYRHRYGAVGASVVKKYKLAREHRRWRDAGAFENMRTVREALAVEAKGADLDEHFAQRRAEMETAERRRRGTLLDDDDDPDAHNPGDIPPQAEVGDMPDVQEEVEPQNPAALDESAAPTAQRHPSVVSEQKSETTCVASSGEEEEEHGKGAIGKSGGPAKVADLDLKKPLNAGHAAMSLGGDLTKPTLAHAVSA